MSTTIAPMPAGRRGLGDEPAIPRQQDLFRTLLQTISLVAAGVHLAFVALFGWAGVTSLAWINVACTLCHLLSYVLVRNDRMLLGWAVLTAEIVAHALGAVVIIGWDAGFHYYVALIIPVLVVSPMRPPALRLGLAGVVVVAYAALAAWARHRVPMHVLDPMVLDGLFYANVFGFVSLLLFLAAFHARLIRRAESKLRKMATTDPLTQLPNRRSLTQAVQREEERIKRNKAPLSFVLCDVDHFKRVNDQHGHEMGDTVLKLVGQVLAEAMRNADFVARWGGEEFLAMLPETGADEAAGVAERLRQRVENLHMGTGGEPLRLSMTFGVATLREGETAEHAINRADAALYQGKHAGRNRVVVARD
jgi:diguanylate cyclase (GGDEF)-like protein